MSKTYQRIVSRKKKRRRRIRIIVTNIVILAVIAAVVVLGPHLLVKSSVTVEAGTQVPAVSSFFRIGGEDASFTEESIGAVDMTVIGTYPLEITMLDGLYTIRTKLVVEDTTPPEAEVQDVSAWLDQELSTEDFIVSVTDATQTQVAFDTEPDTSAAGTYTVTLNVTDVAGNLTQKTAQLEVIEDTEAPVIEGVEEITVVEGGTVSYKSNVTVTDNYDPDVQLTVDNSQVDLDTPGDYEVTYTATDASGNTATVTTTVHVEKQTIDNITEDQINAIADALLAEILDDDMTDYEKAYTIYWWCHDHIAYVDGSEKENWVRGAYMGLVNRQGDCYTYAMTAKCLLTRAGIENMDIAKIPTATSEHYWNLINLGDGWYHFDTTRRADGTTFFYWTDAELMAYSNSHNGSHNYDPSLYPEIQ